MSIYYEDLMDHFDNFAELRKELMKMLRENKNQIYIRKLESVERNKIYRQMYAPLKFEKIREDDGSTTIYVYNSKSKENNSKKEEKLSNGSEIFIEETERNDSNEETESNESNESNDSNDSNESTEGTKDTEGTEYTDTYDDLLKIQDMVGQQIIKIDYISNNVNKIYNWIIIIFFMNMFGWIMLYNLDPVRLVVYNYK
jgi:hypothetical protein